MNYRPCHFFYTISGEKAQELLFRYGIKSEFLIRPSESNKNDYTISVHRGDKVIHVKIINNDGILTLPTGIKFESLANLVQYLVDIQCTLPEADGSLIEMRAPCVIPKEEISVNGGRDRFFHIGISALEAEELLKEEPIGNYLLRESGSVTGEYALVVKWNTGILHIKIHYNNNRFRVDRSSESFRTIAELIENYARLPMMQTNGTFIHLNNFLPSTRFPAYLIEDRIESLKRMARKGSDKDGITDEFEKLHREPESHLFISCKDGRRPENIHKNRYKNIVPYDHTRIKLNEGKENNRDYINANLIEVLSSEERYADFHGLKRRYISTQGCLEDTVGDFWRMMWQENSQIIVMITKELERGRVKCYRYWPDQGIIMHSGLKDELIIEHIEEKNCDHYIRRIFHLSLSKQIKDSNERIGPRKIYHYQFLNWADYECPTDSVQALMEEVNRCSENEIELDAGPLVIHCSAGIGRTGTYIVIDILISLIKKIGGHCSIDIIKTVKMIREQRATMVQTEAQYRFIYQAIAAFIKSARALDEERQHRNRAHSTHSSMGSLPSTPLNQLKNLNLNEYTSSCELYHNITPSPSSLTTSPTAFSSSSMTKNLTGLTRSFPQSINLQHIDPPIVLAPPPPPKKNLLHKKSTQNGNAVIPEQHKVYMTQNSQN